MKDATTRKSGDEALLALHDHFRSQGDGKPAYTDMSADERREYHREAKRRQRQREREAKAEGRAVLNDANLRAALADAALMLLASDGPGASIVRNAVASAFPHMPGVVLTLERKSRSGAMGLKLVDPERMEAMREEAHQAASETKAAAPVPALPTPAVPAKSAPSPSSPVVTEATAPRLPVEPPALDDDIEIPLFLRRAHGEA